MTRNTSISPRLLVAVLTMGLLTAMASVVSAQECSTDADCSEGFHCELYGTETCVVAPGQEQPDCGEPVEFGECVPSPIPCETDADCPAWLGCVVNTGDAPDAGIACEVDANGNCADAEAPEPYPMPEAGFCAWREVTCESDADCPSDFECVDYAQSGGGNDCAAPAIACDPNDPNCEYDVPNCEPEMVEPTTVSACQPREIACEADADCPTDWSCITETWGYCTGSEGGATDADAAPADPNGERVAPPEGECFEETVSRCLPAGLIGGGDLPGGGDGEPRTTNENGDDNGGDIFSGDGDDDSNSRSSCSTVDLSPTAGGLPFAALLLLGLALLPMRRR